MHITPSTPPPPLTVLRHDSYRVGNWLSNCARVLHSCTHISQVLNHVGNLRRFPIPLIPLGHGVNARRGRYEHAQIEALALLYLVLEYNPLSLGLVLKLVKSAATHNGLALLVAGRTKVVHRIKEFVFNLFLGFTTSVPLHSKSGLGSSLTVMMLMLWGHPQLYCYKIAHICYILITMPTNSVKIYFILMTMS